MNVYLGAKSDRLSQLVFLNMEALANGANSGGEWVYDGGELPGTTVTCDSGRYGGCSEVEIVRFDFTTTCTCRSKSVDDPKKLCSA